MQGENAVPSGPSLQVSRELEILEVEPTGDHIRQVIELGNGPAKKRLGHLPDEGFVDRARKGTLLAAVQDERLLGYVLYDLPRRNITIRHLCVSGEARGLALRARRPLFPLQLRRVCDVVAHWGDSKKKGRSPQRPSVSQLNAS